MKAISSSVMPLEVPLARDLMVQLAGHDMLKAKGVTLIAASAPTFFVEDTPTAVLVRQTNARNARMTLPTR